MGMSASQVRFLSLQNRKHTIGNELSTLTNRKMALSRDMNKISKNYTNALNQNILRWSNDSGATYQDLSFDIMMKPNDLNSETPYIVTTRDGRAVLDSVQNLIGYDSSTGKYVTLADAKIFGSGIPSIEGSDLTYENIAKWISESRDKSGKKGNLYTTTDGYSAGTGSGAYVIPDGPLSYGFENALRYQIFENLGLVDKGTANEYLLMVNGKYGSEAAENFGNYEELLRQFINQYRIEGGAAYTVTGDVNNVSTVKFNPGIRGANDYPFIFDDDTKIDMIGGMAVSGDERCFGKYFGKIDNTTGKFIGGSLEGNIALAKLALTEYDTWCKQLKEFNLTSPTSFHFEATSGRTYDTTITDVLQFNKGSSKSNQNAEAISANINGSDHSYVYQALTQSFDHGQDLTTRSWEDLYNTETGDSIVKLRSTIEPGRVEGYSKNDVIVQFIEALANAFGNGSDAATSTYSDGDQWTLNFMVEGMDVDPTLMVDDGQGGKISITEAAARYASKETGNYYGHLTTAQGDYRECTDGWVPIGSNCDTTSDAWTAAKEASIKGDYEKFNGLGQAYADECGWHSFTNFVGGMFETFAGCIVAIVGNTHVLFDGIETWADTYDAGQFRTLDVRNIEKTYFTYYEIFMKEYLQNNRNLLTNSTTNNATSYIPVNDISSRINNSLGSTLTQTLVTDGEYKRTTRVNPTSCPFGCGASYSEGSFVGYTNSDGYLVYDWSYQKPLTNTDGTYQTNPDGSIKYTTEYIRNKPGEINQGAGTYKIGYYTNGDAYYYNNEYSASPVINAKYKLDGNIKLVENGQEKEVYGRGYYITEAEGGNVSQVKTTYCFDNAITYYGSTFNKIVKDANGTVHYFLNGTELSESQKPRYAVVQPSTEFSDGTNTLKVAVNDTHHTKTIHAFISPDDGFKDILKEDIRRAEEALLNYNELMKNFFTQKETKLMDYYDAIFLKISKDGWVCDPHINEKDNEQKAKNYLNNKLQNYDYYVAECKEKADLAGYNYLPKLAVNVRKIFQCHDTSSENQALATYEAEKTLIQSKEKKIDARIQKLETEQQVINTELDNVQKVMKENIDKTFKMFA